MRPRLLAVLLAAAACASSARAQDSGGAGLPQPGQITDALVDAVNAVDEPNLVAVFAYVPLSSQPAAFAELMTRDHKGLKRYASKLEADMKAAGGLTPWDHEVCAVLVNRFQTAIDKSGLPDKKRMRAINDCVLSRVITIQELLMRRRG